MSNSNSINVRSWYTVYCKPRMEWRAASALEEHLQLTVYLPEIRRRVDGQTRCTPLFPRYLFVEANLETIGVSRINTTPGVLRLLSFGEAPQAVPATVINAIRARLDTMNVQEGPPEHGFHTGDAVRFKGGPLRELEAIFVGPMKPSERVRVLIHLLGGFREAEVGADILESISSGLAHKWARRTRGRGRKIRQK